jgi:phage-related protein
MSVVEFPKPVFWIGSSRTDLKEFPDGVQDAMGFALWHAQIGQKHADAKPMKGLGGGGVLEVVANRARSTYRAVYTVRYAGAVYVLHAFQKKSKQGIKTAQCDMVLIRKRLKVAKEHYENWQKQSGKDEA